jgi:hypothetical protein
MHEEGWLPVAANISSKKWVWFGGPGVALWQHLACAESAL